MMKIPSMVVRCKGGMGIEKINVEFTEEEFDIVLKYMEVSEATTVQNAILNAVSIVLDQIDFDT